MVEESGEMAEASDYVELSPVHYKEFPSEFSQKSDPRFNDYFRDQTN